MSLIAGQWVKHKYTPYRKIGKIISRPRGIDTILNEVEWILTTKRISINSISFELGRSRYTHTLSSIEPTELTPEETQLLFKKGLL